MDVQPGSTIKVTVTKAPRSEAAAKTLSRLFAKEPAIQPAKRKRTKVLQAAVRSQRRGGRPWEVRPKAPRFCNPKMGDACTLFASLDVIRDLGSVAKFVNIQSGK